MSKEIKSYYECFVNLEATEKSTIEFREWHITSKNKNGVYIRVKNYFTWGKKSKKNGDYGWLPNSDPYYSKIITEENDHIKQGLHLSKESAYKSVLPEIKKYKRDILRLLAMAEKNSGKVKKPKSLFPKPNPLCY